MIGRILGHFEITAKLGEGGMGEVYRATDTKLGREVAIKVLPETMASDPEWLERFRREAKALAAVDHPNIVTVHSVEEADGVHFLTMGLVEGRSLDRLVPAGGLAPDRFFEIALPLVEAVAAAHRKGITHRDLKPANVMVTDGGLLKVLDFGLAKLADPSSEPDETRMATAAMTRAGMLVGTAPYMSPEQIEGRPADPRSDVFSLGIVLFEIATGQRPFAGDSDISLLTSILRDPPPALREVSTAAPERLQPILERCLEKNPDERFQDAGQLRGALAELRTRLDSGIGPAGDLPPAAASPRRPRRLGLIAAGIAAAAIIAVAGVRYQQRSAQLDWAENEALPELERIVDEIQGLQEGPESWRAYELARQIEKVVPESPRLERLWPEFTREIAITSSPPGAQVFARYYGAPDADWTPIGVTPLENLRYPLGFTRLKLELPGHRTGYDLVWNFGFIADEWSFALHPDRVLPDEMELVPAGALLLFIPGLDHLELEPTDSFLIDRYEVTNTEYKAFVEAGAYTNREYWQHAFLEDGQEIPFETATERFVDRTGQPGPATWEVGDYPDGTAYQPVTGVSWYEAAAYAQWAKKSLPTIFHWNRVAFTVASAQIGPLANFDGDGPWPVTDSVSINRYGVFDLAGNVREWVWNESDGPDQRFILGGGWNDPPYAFTDVYAQSVWDRSPGNGFRCIRYLEPDQNEARLTRMLERPFRDFKSETPVPEETFEHYLRQYTYDKTPLEAEVEEEIDEPGYTRQKISFEAAYGGERMMAYLFLPKDEEPPFQTVVYFPGSGAISRRSSEDLEPGRLDFIVKSGRALLYPVYKGTFERGGELESDYPSETAFWRDYVVMWGKDLARSIDYLETRKDIDAQRIAYYGLSWGGTMGSILPAIEPRIRANVLYVAGLLFQRALPEVDQINYVTRVTQPTLMLNGELDFFFPEETSQKPMFDLLGTPDEHKKRLVYPGGHSVPRTEMIKESLAWLDRYLGPVGSPAGAE